MSMRKQKGFTLVEILIVVVILGILAAIVIPQFSDASTQSKVSSAASSIQTLRSQLSLYKIQHKDIAPTLIQMNVDATTPTTGVMTGETDDAGAVAAGNPFGPYVQTIPTNPWNGKNSLAAAPVAGNGWVYEVDANQNISIYLDPTDVGNAAVVTELKSKGVCEP